MRKLILALACLTASCGFTPQGDAVRLGVAKYGAQAMDEGLVNAEWFICNAASIGSIKRRYGKSADLAEHYRALCDLDPNADVLGAPE